MQPGHCVGSSSIDKDTPTSQLFCELDVGDTELSSFEESRMLQESTQDVSRFHPCAASWQRSFGFVVVNLLWLAMVQQYLIVSPRVACAQIRHACNMDAARASLVASRWFQWRRANAQRVGTADG